MSEQDSILEELLGFLTGSASKGSPIAEVGARAGEAIGERVSNPPQGPMPEPRETSLVEDFLSMAGSVGTNGPLGAAGRATGEALSDPYTRRDLGQMLSGALQGANNKARSITGKDLLPFMGEDLPDLEYPGAPLPSEEEFNAQKAASERALMDVMDSLKSSGGSRAFVAKGDDVRGLAGGEGSFSKASEGTAARAYKNLGGSKTPEMQAEALSKLGLSGPLAEIVASLASSDDPRAQANAASMVQAFTQQQKENTTAGDFYEALSLALAATGNEEARALLAMMADPNNSIEVRKSADERRRELIKAAG